MKKAFIIILTAAIAVSTTACSSVKPKSSSAESTVEKGTIQEISTAEVTTEAPTEPPKSAISPGNYVQQSNFKFSFEKAAQYDEISYNDLYTNTPEDGKVYVVMFYEVENVSNESQHVNMFYIKGYIDDYETQQSTLLADIDGYESLGGDLDPGKKLKGYVAFEANKDWKKLEMIYTDGIGSKADKYEFEVSTNDLN